MPPITTKNLPSREERREIGKKARAIYEPLREKLEKEHWGEYISINVETGDYAIASDHEEAIKKMRTKYPDQLSFTIRIGYRAIAHFRGLGATDGLRQ